MRTPLALLTLALASGIAGAAEPFDTHGRVRVSKSKTHLEHADGTPFFFLADTCWTGPALSTEAEWAEYLADRKKKGFTAVQFNMVSPWRTAPTDAEGRRSYTLTDGKFAVNEDFYAKRLDARIKAINDAGLLAVPILCWAHKKGDAGKELTEAQLTELVKFELNRYKDTHALWILAGDNQYTTDAEMWKRIGRAAFGDNFPAPVTTHPTGENWPWKAWEDEKWLTVLGYQSGHGDSSKTLNWLTQGPPAEYGRRKEFARPVINLEPPYEAHLGYSKKEPHSALSVRRAIYWSLLVTPTAGVTYGGHGVWSWHTKPGQPPTDHGGSGNAKHWRDALNLPGATEAGIARKIFETLPWTELRPAQELLASQDGKDPELWDVCAATPDRGTVVIYSPDGTEFAFAKPTASAYRVRWFDPRTGKDLGLIESYVAPDGTKDLLMVLTK